jgi:hypothetical protein
MAYKLSSRKTQDKVSTHDSHPDHVDLGKLATVFIIFGLLSLLTAWIYSMETEKIANASFRPSKISGISAEVGPINVRKHNESYSINIKASLYSQSWSSIQGQVLDSNKQYLFSFGKELSYYTGRDSEGSWSELDNDYSMNVTFPKPGAYYLQFDTESNVIPKNVKVKVTKKRGSSIPHMWFGIIVLIIGIVMNEIKNRSLIRVIEKFSDN